MKPAMLLVVLALLLAACQSAPAIPPTPLPTHTPAPTVDARATNTAIAVSVKSTLAADLTATARAEQDIADATATAVQAKVLANQTATAAQATKLAGQTATQRARWTDTPEPTSTNTATSTSTPRPTNTPGPSPTPRPSNTPVPPTAPPSSFAITFTDMRYETWGRPVGDPNPCSLFDNSQPQRKFNVNVTLTNNGGATTGFWFVDAYDSNGAELITCFYVYGYPAVPPGESRAVTWAAWTANDTWVTRYVVSIYDEANENVIQTFRQCFGAGGELAGC